MRSKVNENFPTSDHIFGFDDEPRIWLNSSSTLLVDDWISISIVVLIDTTTFAQVFELFWNFSSLNFLIHFYDLLMGKSLKPWNGAARTEPWLSSLTSGSLGVHPLFALKIERVLPWLWHLVPGSSHSCLVKFSLE